MQAAFTFLWASLGILLGDLDCHSLHFGVLAKAEFSPGNRKGRCQTPGPAAPPEMPESWGGAACHLLPAGPGFLQEFLTTPSPMCGLGKPSPMSSHRFLQVKDDLSSQYYTQRPHVPTTQETGQRCAVASSHQRPWLCAWLGTTVSCRPSCLMPGLFLPQGHRLLRTMASFSLQIPLLPLGPGCACALTALPEGGSTLTGRRPGDPQAKGLWVWVLNPFSLALRSNTWR